MAVTTPVNYTSIETMATLIGIVATFFSIVGFVGVPIIKLNRTLARMSVTFDVMEKRVCKQEEVNDNEHKELRIKDAELEHAVNANTKDIAVIKQVLKDDLAE